MGKNARTFGQDLMRGEHIVKPLARNLHDGTVIGNGGLADQMGANLVANRQVGGGK